ncbi:MAG: thioesterase family protein [Gammaproteobacteria bacterium]|nr:thioesterase family protein [Gammaproteobacteria bacterium]MCZ6855895.1 thioesterase family protein [Gammaproteobacteria bacterium]
MANTLPSAEVTIDVPFHDLDPMEIVWHGRYAQYFEVARCKLLEQIGYTYQDMQASGYAWPIIDMRIQYVRPARFNQRLIVRATLREYENRLKIRYEIRDADSGERVTKGYTCQVAVRISDGAMQMVSPEVLLKKLGV